MIGFQNLMVPTNQQIKHSRFMVYLRGVLRFAHGNIIYTYVNGIRFIHKVYYDKMYVMWVMVKKTVIILYWRFIGSEGYTYVSKKNGEIILL